MRAVEKLKAVLLSRAPVVYIVSWEEQRVDKAVIDIAGRTFKTPVEVFFWSSALGLLTANSKEVNPSLTDPESALKWSLKYEKTAYHVYHDLHLFWDKPAVLRSVREFYRAFGPTYRRLIIVSPRLQLPVELEKELTVFDFPLPDREELEAIYVAVRDSYMKQSKTAVKDNETAKRKIIHAGLGLTLDEARDAFTQAMKAVIDDASVETVLARKRQLIRKSGVLEFVQHNYRIEDVGGMENLKEWSRKRADIFDKGAEQFGLTPPKGVLMTGISGCGKSLCVQAIASYWKLPLIRLDLNLVYAGVVNNPEETLDRALRVAETMAPCVLWIDEIEKGVSRTPTGSTLGPTARIFSRFLTWMQEKEGLVFIAATANEIDLLAPEFLRKGRFDEIFFVDLPNEDERAEIFGVHLKKRKQDVTRFNLRNLAKATVNFSGSEIEQVVISALFDAYDQKRRLEEKDLYSAIGKTVPLATTMAEDIKKIKRWALDRAVKASK